MPLSKMGNFSFNHADQQDALYEVLSALEVKQKFDSRADELKAKLNALIDILQSTTTDSGAKNIAATSITGLAGNDVQTLLSALKTLSDNLQSQISSNDTDISNLQTNKADATVTDSLQTQVTSNDSDISNLKTRTSTNELDIENLKDKDVNLQGQIDALNNTYSTDAERIAAINDVINQFEIADDDLEVMINNKANKTDVYAKTETYTREQTRSLVYDTDTEARVLYQGGTHVTITHNLNDYPSVNVVAKNAFGHYGYGSGEYGSSGNFNIPASVDYPNENQVVVSLIENYVGNHTVTLNGNVARVTFPDEDGIYLDVYLRGNS